MPYCNQIYFQEYLILKKNTKSYVIHLDSKNITIKYQRFIDPKFQYNCWITLFPITNSKLQRWLKINSEKLSLRCPLRVTVINTIVPERSNYVGCNNNKR